jgi:hypothetical protein
MPSYQDLLDQLKQSKNDTSDSEDSASLPITQQPQDSAKSAALNQMIQQGANPTPSDMTQMAKQQQQSPNPSMFRSLLQSTIGDKANSPGDDSVKPSMSPLDVLPYGEMANAGLAAGKGAVNAISEAAPRLLGNEIGSIGRNVLSKSESDLLAKYGGVEALEGLTGNQLPSEMTGMERLALQKARSIPNSQQAADAMYAQKAVNQPTVFDKARQVATDNGIGPTAQDSMAMSAEKRAVLDRIVARNQQQLADAKNVPLKIQQKSIKDILKGNKD